MRWKCSQSKCLEKIKTNLQPFKSKQTDLFGTFRIGCLACDEQDNRIRNYLPAGMKTICMDWTQISTLMLFPCRHYCMQRRACTKVSKCAADDISYFRQHQVILLQKGL